MIFINEIKSMGRTFVGQNITGLANDSSTDRPMFIFMKYGRTSGCNISKFQLDNALHCKVNIH